MLSVFIVRDSFSILRVYKVNCIFFIRQHFAVGRNTLVGSSLDVSQQILSYHASQYSSLCPTSYDASQSEKSHAVNSSFFIFISTQPWLRTLIQAGRQKSYNGIVKWWTGKLIFIANHEWIVTTARKSFLVVKNDDKRDRNRFVNKQCLLFVVGGKRRQVWYGNRIH